MSDGEKKYMIDPVARPTARDALVYAAGEKHGLCSVKHKSVVRNGQIVFTCMCGTKYIVGANRFVTDALRNVTVDVDL